MHVTTQTEWEELLRKRSLILHRPKNDPHRPPRFFQCVDFSKPGLQRMLEERMGENGSLPFHREEVKKALAAWTTFNSSQIKKAPKPLGLWAEAIDQNRAWVRVIEAECREINRLLDEARAKEASTAKAQHRKPLGHMKMRGGVLAQVDGRAVVAGEDGDFTFSDNGESVTIYLHDLKQAKIEKTVAKQKADRERRERIHAAMGIEPRKRLRKRLTKAA